MMYLLDTDVIIGLFKGDPAVASAVKRIAEEHLFVSSMSLCELYRGAYLSSRPEEEIQYIANLLSSARMVCLDEKACRYFGQAFAILKRAGNPTQEIDLMVGSIAIANNLILVTRNKKHFMNIPGLKVENW